MSLPGWDDVVALFSPRGYFFWLLVVSAFVCALERVRRFRWRAEQRALRRGIAQDAFWLVFNGHFASLLIAVPAAWASERVDDLFAIAGLPAPASIMLLPQLGAPFVAHVIMIVVAKDFLDWCIHRLLHRVPVLWSFHKVHHSIEELDWIGSFRFHWMEIVVYRSLSYVPLIMLGVDGDAILVAAVIGTLIGHLNHANLDADWGPLRYVINSPRFHAWHHARIPASQYGNNFAVVFSAWDWLFRTAHYPSARDQPAQLGFDGDDRYPRSLLARIAYPLSAVASVIAGRGFRPPPS